MKARGLTLMMALLAAGILISRCGGDGGEDPLPTECETDEFEATFVVDTLSIPDEDVGFDLDDEDTYCETGCINDGENGVDNRLGAVLDGLSESLGGDFDANVSLEEQITEGSLLILFRLLKICNFTADGEVDLMGYVGEETDDPEDPLDNFSGTEPFDVHIDSLNEPKDDVNDPLISFPGAEIRRNQFNAGPSTFALDIPIEDSILHLEIRETQMQFNFDPAPTASGDHHLNGRIVNGLLGGFVLVEDLSDALQEFASELGDIDAETVMNIVVNQADIDFVQEGDTADTCETNDDCPVPWRSCTDAGVCYEPPERMDAISLAIQFEGTSCEFTGVIYEPEDPPPPSP